MDEILDYRRKFGLTTMLAAFVAAILGITFLDLHKIENRSTRPSRFYRYGFRSAVWATSDVIDALGTRICTLEWQLHDAQVTANEDEARTTDLERRIGTLEQQTGVSVSTSGWKSRY